ncbi:MAG: NifB/NifX family molybdenum-iron cluster-binding protein [Chitinispirillaceae bacterium]
METIAVTDWNSIVSPLYDSSCCLLVIKPDGERTVLDVKHRSLVQKADLCVELGVQVLICGAISNIAHAMLTDRNIRVMSWLSGPVEELLEAYRKKRDMVGLFGMPGCGRRRCGKMRFRGGRRKEP